MGMTPVEVDWTMGVNRQVGPSEMEDNAVYETRNLIPTKFGLTNRPTLQFHSPSGMVSAVPLASQGPISPSAGFFATVVWGQGGVIDNKVALSLLDGSTGATVQVILDSVAVPPKASITSFRDAQYIFGNVPGAEFRRKLVGADLSVFDFDGTGNENLYPAIMARYRDRAVYAHFGLGHERNIVFSDNFLAGLIGDSALTSRSIFVGDDGDHIVAMREISITGDRVRPALLVLLEHSAYIITGQPNQTTDGAFGFGDLEVSRLPYNAGCASAATLVNTPYGLIWAGPDNVWLFQSGQAIIPIGAKIREVLENTPRGFLYRWSAAYFDGFYRLAVFSEGQSGDDTSALGEQWWLDLRTREVAPRDEMTARWFGPQVFLRTHSDDGITPAVQVGTYLFATDTRPGAAPGLWGVEAGWASFSPTMVLVSYGVQPGERDITYDDSLTANSIPVGTEIVPSITSRIFGLERKVSTLDKIFRKGEVGIMVHDSARLMYTCNNDRGAQMDEVMKDINRYGMAAGELLDDENLQDKVQGIAFWPEPTTRNPARSMQFSLEGMAGYVIDATNDRLVFEDAGIVYVATITRDAYTITELLTEIVAQMNAVSPHTYTFTRAVTGKVRLHTDSGATFKLYFTTTPSGATFGWVSASRRLGSILGFNTGIDATGGPNIDAVDSVYETHVPYWELYGMSALVKMTGSRPQ